MRHPEELILVADAPVALAENVTSRPLPRRRPWGRPSVDGKFLKVGDDRFWVKAVTYGTFAPNEDGEPYPPFHQVKDDFARMAEAGVNTVRLYTPPTDRLADAAVAAGLFLMPDICWGPRNCEFDYPDALRHIHQWVGGHAKRLAGHPAILMYSLGNELSPLVSRWYGHQTIKQFIKDVWETTKENAPHTLTTYCNFPPTEYLHLPFLDVMSFNLYLEREKDFRSYLARLHTLAGNRPVFLSEIGLDSRSHGNEQQARTISWQLRAAQEKGICGAAVYAWTDQWAIFNNDIQGWAFGLTDTVRSPKPALDAVSRIYNSSKYDLRETTWPRVSVVVASYNGAKTLDECLTSLDRLNYPNYETIVVDDGSKDRTPEIVARHEVRSIKVPNGGLSRARNLGIEAATGEIVAFIDSDAYADPDWLYYMVNALEEHDAAGVGGPNLAPPQDGFAAECVDHAPGNPTHVLLTDELAEHVPGCNMAFRKSALEAIAKFDPTHRAAGDDVDVCWKLLVRDQKIAFAPSAVVWHHRRPSIKAFLKQQKGYGFAEAHLKRRYPGRFNVFGDLVWKGGVYDSAQTQLRMQGVPLLFKPKIYQGWFGGAIFQSIYQRFQNWWFQIFTTAEWQVLSWSVLLTGLLTLLFTAPLAGGIILALATGMIGATVGAASIPAIHAVKARPWKGWERIKGFMVVGMLHLLQPLVRYAGYIKGLWASRGQTVEYKPVQRIWGDTSQRTDWLVRLQKHLEDCGWRCKASEPWSESDIDVTGPGPYSVSLCSTTEEDLKTGGRNVRFRVRAKMRRIVPLLWLFVAAAAASTIALPTTLPLLLPLAFIAKRLAGAKTFMTTAVTQLALECAGGRNMPRVEYS